MPVSDPASAVEIDLSRAEQWVAHHVLLDSLGLADGDSPDETDRQATDAARDALGKLETGRFEFTAAELDVLARACRQHARTTGAAADRNLATAISDRIGETVRGQRSSTDE